MAQDWLQKSVQGIADPTARKQEYYKRQRENANEGGNQALSDQINKKLGKKSSSVDTEAGNKLFLGTVPFLAGPGEAGLAGAALKRVAPKAASALEGAAGAVAKGAGDLASKVMNRGSQRSAGTVAKDFAKSVSSNPAAKTAARTVSKVASNKETKNFAADGSRKSPMVKSGEKEKVMSNMKSARPSDPGRERTNFTREKEVDTMRKTSAKRSAKDVSKDFGSQAKATHTKAPPSSPSRGKGFSGGGFSSSSHAHGKVKTSKKAN